MIAISKILTQNKKLVLEALANDQNSVRRHDYFCMGNPILDPPTIRGSIIIYLAFDFLLENERNFNYGSLTDIGSIRSGLIDVSDPTSFEERSKCDFTTFVALIKELQNCSLLDSLLKTREYDSATIKLLSKYLDESILQELRIAKDPHMCLFEFKMNYGYVLKPEHVVGLHVPNTYMQSSQIEKLRHKLVNRIIQYNPKYGIEYSA